ncbi:hypothetical protein AG1IA_08799 [Rhizoctonia solani AG-1 IA]|uniref:Uncharacterized protein n=1 Tax=Thanatephorus cucumeris (strain AG1-IA) TaxID=983506 RepID=L8WGV4_THACA|nr:hypothetical protein AG1IA_08799 [Rhizoctonia solani AG-1 IA]
MRLAPWIYSSTVDPKSADFLNVKNRALCAECWQNPTSFSMNPHPQLTPVCRQGAYSAILGADVWQNLDVMRIFRTFGVHRVRTKPLRSMHNYPHELTLEYLSCSHAITVFYSSLFWFWQPSFPLWKGSRGDMEQLYHIHQYCRIRGFVQ